MQRLWSREQSASTRPRARTPVALKPVGDRGLLVELGDTIDPAVEDRVISLDAAVSAARITGIEETIVAYTSLLVIFDPVVTDFDRLCTSIAALAAHAPRSRDAVRAWRVPVVYGGDFGFDLEHVARHCAMTPAEVVAAHAGACYTIAMFGFLPGFAYLAGLPPELAVPRRATPRDLVPAGSIAIGGAQTAIGSIAGPCGWHVIARTPLRTFDPARYPATIFAPGDEIRFTPVPAEAFAGLEQRAHDGDTLAERVA